MTKLIISEELTQMLKNQKDKTLSKVIDSLLNMEVDETAKNYINYISVAVDNSAKLSYLTKAKIEGLSPYMPIFDIPDGRLWAKDYRIMAKPGKVLKQLLPEVSDIAMEKFASMYKNECAICGDCLNEKDIVIVKNDDIRKYYHEEFYSLTDGQEDGNNSDINQSCMRGEEAQTYFDIYTKNSAVSMAIMFDDGGEHIKCRCILWAINGKNYYDRIYAVNNEVNRNMQACLEKLGYINISGKNIIVPYHEYTLNLKLEYGKNDIEQFPYMDTMQWLSGKILSNGSTSGATQLQDTEGSYIRETSCCDCCSEECQEDDIYYIERGDERHSNMCTDCSVWSNYYDCYIAESEATKTTHDDWILDRDKQTLYDGASCHEDNATKLYNGEYAHTNETIFTDVNGDDFILGDENFEEIEEEYYNINSTEYDEKIRELEEA